MKKNAYLVILGKQIADLRKAKGFTQEVFANELGYDRGYYSRVERGINNITMSTLIRIAKGLRTPLAELLLTLDQKIQKELSTKKKSTT